MMFYLTHSLETVGYRVRVWHRPAFRVVGYTYLIPADAPSGYVHNLWRTLKLDGRIQSLSRSTPIRPWILGLGSWDPACEENGYRYTICIEKTARTDVSMLPNHYIKEIGATDWMYFELDSAAYPQPFWSDNPHLMIEKLGYKFNRSENNDYSVGLHFDAYPPDFDAVRNPRMEFWISVRKPVMQMKINIRSLAGLSG